MEESVASHQIDLGLFAVEVLEQSRFGNLSTDAKKVVNFLDSLKGFLPEVHSDRALQLLEANVHQTLDSVRLVKLERVILFLVLLGLHQVVTKLHTRVKREGV